MFFTLEDFRKIEEYLKQNSKKDTDFEALSAKDITSEDSIAIVHNLQNRKVNIFDLLLSDITGVFADEKELLNNKISELEELINVFKIEKVGLADQLGDSQTVTVTLKTITEAFHRIWAVLESITGEVYSGIHMYITPESYVGEEGCTVHIIASTVRADHSTPSTTGTFEHIAFFINDNLIAEYDNEDYIELDVPITGTSIIKCAAKIAGETYVELRLITHHPAFWVGAGTTYMDVMNNNNLVSIDNGMRCAKDVTVSDGDRIFVIMGESLSDKFIRADINGIEIDMTELIVTLDDLRYKVFTSENAYSAGTYNIDING